MYDNVCKMQNLILIIPSISKRNFLSIQKTVGNRVMLVLWMTCPATCKFMNVAVGRLPAGVQADG